MPKHRVCSVCNLDKFFSPELTVFTIEGGDGRDRQVCENHFKIEDIYNHGDTKR